MNTKILVIEDMHHLRNDVVEMLSYEGFEVRGAENGRLGVEMAREFRPDLIICDIMMPELDGYGVLRELRQDEKMATTPFIFLTAKTDRADVRTGMGMGAEDYIPKPFMTHELLETINARLERHKTFEAVAEHKLHTLRTNIATSLPHELRTPLNTIIGFADILSAEAMRLSPTQVAEWSNHINNAAQRLYRLIENYLTYVRVESILKAPISDNPSLLNDTLTSAPVIVIEFESNAQAQLAERQSDLVLNFDDTPIKGIVIAEADLAKITSELVNNAFKFSENGTPVTVEAYVEGDFYKITVTDEGSGISQEQIDNIGGFMQFERWFYEQQGTGLGLVICKRLTEFYKGTFVIESEVHRGTCVTVSLPLA
jgi:two-component system, sensor histidine kinase and response regulator